MGGDTHLGGADLTNQLVAQVFEFLKRQYKVDISRDKRAKRRVFNACEKAKLRLSSQEEAHIELDKILPRVDFYTTVTRQTFEELCESLFFKVMGPLRVFSRTPASTGAKLTRLSWWAALPEF